MLKRRTFVLGGVGAAGALVVGWSVLPPRQRLIPSAPLPLNGTQVALNGWVKVAADNSVTVVMSKAEMGQGVHTGTAMLLAEEMDADWSQVKVEHSPIDAIYNNMENVVGDLPFRPDDHSARERLAAWMTRKVTRDFGMMITGGSSSINDLWLPMREAGASARAMLLAAAAAKWHVPVAECRAEAGKVLHPSGRTASFGELATLAAQQLLPAKVVLKTPSAFKLIGKPVPRVDTRAKLDGSARFGIDVLPDHLLYASVVMCPTLGGKVAHFDGAVAAALPGVVKVFAVAPYNGGSGGVAVIAANAFIAMNALDVVRVEWDHGAAAGLSSADVNRHLAQALDSGDGHAYYSQGDVDAALATAARTLSAEYRVPYLAHGALEPINCTVQVMDGAATVWVSTQVPALARAHAAKVLGIDADNVDVQEQLLGGAFGRRLEVDYVSQATAIAREVRGRPVQTIWSRPQDMTHDFYRPACVSRFKGGLDGAGKLVAWHNASASQSVVASALVRYFGVPSPDIDRTTVEGAFDQPYEWPNVRVGHKIVDLPIPVGFWRSVGHSHQAFFTESFMDELAAAAGKDPVAFRAGLLTHHPRHLAVLQRAAARASWGRPLAPSADGAARARGVALHEAFGSIAAQVAEVSLAPDRRIRVHRVVCVIDCGTPVNPNLIRQQVEGAIVFGLSAALYDEITLVNGQVQQQYYTDFPVVHMNDCPVIETEIMPSEAHPQGVGEIGTPPVAPAVANAIFALTGTRLRVLPLKLI
ncbi:MAG TPA: molybdopterin cofactor-binding domain-containing protein [Paraburkholderia sp.]|jgi:isoquinoline 1-oxidoreductase beta subunit|nr:molybdopterin cofactor-binding domain-containing protein [Paraburkholderia sp.]